MADISGANKLLDKFKSQIKSNKLEDARETLTDLKVKLVDFTALPPLLQSTSTKDQELMLARDMLEHSVLLAVQLQDDALFVRNFTQLKAYYTDLRGAMPASQQEHPLLGLNLLRLLAQNRIADFHVELELYDDSALASPHIDFPRQLERQLMEGLYDKLYGAMDSAPSPHMHNFVTQLQATVRAELASCAAAAYDKLLLKDAAQMLRFDVQQDMAAFCKQQGWRTDSQYVYFAAPPGKSSGQENMDVFHNVLMYARELDRIV